MSLQAPSCAIPKSRTLLTKGPRVRVAKSLLALLPELKPLVTDPRHLWNGRHFPKFHMLPRELLGNWLLGTILEFEEGRTGWTIAEDHVGDGYLLHRPDRRGRWMEHVLVHQRNQASRTVEECVVAALAHKANPRHGPQYASGKTLVIFSEAKGAWHPSRVRWLIFGRHAFNDVWVMHPEHAGPARRAYCVALLTQLWGEAPAWRVVIEPGFDDWQVWRVQ